LAVVLAELNRASGTVPVDKADALMPVVLVVNITFESSLASGTVPVDNADALMPVVLVVKIIFASNRAIGTVPVDNALAFMPVVLVVSITFESSLASGTVPVDNAVAFRAVSAVPVPANADALTLPVKVLSPANVCVDVFTNPLTVELASGACEAITRHFCIEVFAS